MTVEAITDRFPAWDEPLVRLYDVLAGEALASVGTWVGRTMSPPRLALVTFRAKPTDAGPVCLQVRIARPVPPGTDLERAQWRDEVSVYRHFMRLDESPPWSHRTEKDGQVVVFEETLP